MFKTFDFIIFSILIISVIWYVSSGIGREGMENKKIEQVDDKLESILDPSEEKKENPKPADIIDSSSKACNADNNLISEQLMNFLSKNNLEVCLKKINKQNNVKPKSNDDDNNTKSKPKDVDQLWSPPPRTLEPSQPLGSEYCKKGCIKPTYGTCMNDGSNLCRYIEDPTGVTNGYMACKYLHGKGMKQSDCSRCEEVLFTTDCYDVAKKRANKIMELQQTDDTEPSDFPSKSDSKPFLPSAYPSHPEQFRTNPKPYFNPIVFPP